jgi:hypothetical protein
MSQELFENLQKGIGEYGNTNPHCIEQIDQLIVTDFSFKNYENEGRHSQFGLHNMRKDISASTIKLRVSFSQIFIPLHPT